VGEADGGGLTSGLIEHLDGGVWTVVPSPDLGVTTPSGGGYLDAIACPSAEECWAAGGGPEAQGPPVLEHLSSGRWAMEPVSGQPGGSGTLSGVACASPGDCWAVGYDQLPPNEVDVVEHYDGAAWTAMSVSAPPGAELGAYNLGIGSDARSGFGAVGYGARTGQDSALIETTAAAG